MEHKNCCQRVIWELEQCERLIDELKDENESLKAELDSVKAKLDAESRLTGDFALDNYDLREENKSLKVELERSVEQMAELEGQMKRMADQYNELARSTTYSIPGCFEPVREVEDE